MGNQSGIGQHELCKRALQVCESSGAAVNLIARDKVGDTLADSFYGAGKVHTKHSGQIRRKR